MRRLLVTGGAGFIGSNFVHYWRSRHPDDVLFVLDALTYAGNLASISTLIGQGHVRFVRGDVADESIVAQVFAEHAIDTVVHFAAESHVDRSIKYPADFVRTNVVGTHMLLDAARHAWQTGCGWQPGVRFHNVSTDEVFGSLSHTAPPFTEASPYLPSSPYAASKAAADHLVRAYAHTYGLPVSISNCSNNYGPFQFPEKLIPLVIVNALDGRTLPVYGDGCQVRDWLFVDDHCSAIERILLADVGGASFNIGGRTEQTNLDIVHAICSFLDAKFAASASLRDRWANCPASSGASCSELVAFVTDRPGHDRRYAIDASYISETLGVVPGVALQHGLERTVDWYLHNEPWWRAVMDGSYRSWVSAPYG